jgi:hypothetical protein
MPRSTKSLKSLRVPPYADTPPDREDREGAQEGHTTGCPPASASLPSCCLLTRVLSPRGRTMLQASLSSPQAYVQRRVHARMRPSIGV